jgi:K+-sensing histidine kinase KdpD
MVLSGLGWGLIAGRLAFGFAISQRIGTKLWVLPDLSLSALMLWVVALTVGCAWMAARRQSKLTTQLEQRIEARTQQLQTSMAELEETSNLQDVLLYAISHDIRTTMMGCVMVLERVQEYAQEEGDERSGMVLVSRELLQRMTQSGRTQLDRVNLLLETHAHVTSGRAVQKQQVRLGEIVEGAIGELQPLLQNNQVWVANQTVADLRVQADPVALQQVFYQVIANAARHNPPGVEVRLESQVDDAVLRLRVIDNGVGIEPVEIQPIFNLRLKPEQERQLTRISLGLCLCKQIMVAHGGEMGISSAIGKGTEVWFTLPLTD